MSVLLTCGRVGERERCGFPSGGCGDGSDYGSVVDLDWWTICLVLIFGVSYAVTYGSQQT